MIKKAVPLIAALALVFSITTGALAQSGIGSGVVNGVNGATNPAAGSSNIQASDLPKNPITLDQLFVTLLKDVFIGLAVAAFLALIWAGIMYITAGGDASKAEKARKSILYTLIGVVLAVLSYGIIVYVSQLTSSGLTSGTAGTASTNSSSTGNVKTNPKIGTKNPDGSYYNPCVSETPAGCIDSDGFQTGVHSSELGTLGDTSAAASPVPPNAQYGLTIADPDNTMSGDTVTVTRGQAFNHPYGVSLATQPVGGVTVTVAATGSLGLRVSDSSLTFSPADYSESQGVNVQYLGGGKVGDAATVTLTGSDGSVATIKFVIQ